MNADERRSPVNTVNRVNAINMILSLLFVGLAPGWQVYLLAEDACPDQEDFRSSIPAHIQIPADPNLAEGVVLGPVPHDPNCWTAPEGPYKRDWTTACDKEGDSFTIRFVDGSSVAVIQRDIPGKLWTFSATVYGGLNTWLFEADDGHSVRRVWVFVEGIENEPPILAAIRNWLEVS